MSEPERFPLGEPTNRPKPKGLEPVAGRPNWWRDPVTKVERYIEPPRPVQPIPPI